MDGIRIGAGCKRRIADCGLRSDFGVQFQLHHLTNNFNVRCEIQAKIDFSFYFCLHLHFRSFAAICSDTINILCSDRVADRQFKRTSYLRNKFHLRIKPNVQSGNRAYAQSTQFCHIVHLSGNTNRTGKCRIHTIGDRFLTTCYTNINFTSHTQFNFSVDFSLKQGSLACFPSLVGIKCKLMSYFQFTMVVHITIGFFY